MPLILQNDNGTQLDANALIDIVFADAFHTERNNDDWLSLSVPEKEAAIIIATDYISYRYQYIGWRRAEAQTTEFPRYDLVDSSGWEIRGIPLKVKQAVAVLADIASVEGSELAPNPVYDPRGTVKKIAEKVDVIAESIEFAAPDHGRLDPGKMPSYPQVHRLLRDFIRGGSRISLNRA